MKRLADDSGAGHQNVIRIDLRSLLSLVGSAWALWIASRIPFSPVHALAQPEFKMMARTFPRERLRCLRLTMTGAASTWLSVKTAEPFAGNEEKMSARSGPPFFNPAVTPQAR